ncbi:P-loop NTPase family protein [Actibacterium pelagium]|uniref:Chromosome partitioning ATPase, Mrp family, contains Fe-S cluster n=1 Tax=Actibacterium pelagium TaxID=2029103 RepID=A0A917ALD3_9RHOB|nr:hypothetical protein [Actibacterium pelagium]GGE56889.1 hypothetical protein GCM10011517_25840 [Actibacterium pelagium]
MTTVLSASARSEPTLQMSSNVAWNGIPFAANPSWPDPLQPHADHLAIRVLRQSEALKLRRIGIAAPRNQKSETSLTSLLLQGFRHLEGTKVFAFDLNTGSNGFTAFLARKAVPAQTNKQMTTASFRLAPNLAVSQIADPAISSMSCLTSYATLDEIDQIDAEFQPDLMLFDLPALLDHPDALAAAPMLDGLLICVPSDVTTERDLSMCRDRFEGILPIIGSVLTESRGMI